jgi:transposase
VIDRGSSLPLYFRYLPGNVVDVSSLNVTVEELRKFGIRSSFALIDAGFFSEDNIARLFAEKIDFLTRLPSNRTLYSELVEQEMPDIELFKNAVRYGERVLFIKQKRVNLFGNEAYAHIILDPERKGRETKKLLINAIEERETDEESVEFELLKSGVMVLVSSFDIDMKEGVLLYYMRQLVEKFIGFSKDDLNLISLRVHKEETLRGYLPLIFITLTVFALLRKEMNSEFTVEEALLIMRNLKCKVFDDEILVQEMAKQQKKVVGKLNIIVPKKMGV